jgi:hypothetical protein
MIVQTSITPDLYDKLEHSDYVAVRTYTNQDGSQYAKVYAAGSLEDMRELADRPQLLIVRPPLESISDSVVAVRELLPPD